MPVQIKICQPLLHKITTVLSFVCFLSFGNTAGAATVSSLQNDDSECSFLLEGEIKAGDAEQLSKKFGIFYHQVNRTIFNSPVYVCLNSPGGSLLEGVDLAKVIIDLGLATRIPENSVCLSACAIAFMAGSFFHPEGDGGSSTVRTMHPTARLGFHAPSLTIPQGQYNEVSVEKAYNVALQAVAAVSDLRATNVIQEFAESIFITFLRTPSSTFTYIDTVGAATRLGVKISPVPVFDGKLGAAVSNLCENAVSRYSDIDIEKDWGRIQNKADFLANNLNVDGSEIVYDDGFFIASEIVYNGGFYEEGNVSCHIKQYNISKGIDYDFRVSFPYGGGTFPGYQNVFGSSATYPPTTLISELPIASKSQMMTKVKLTDTIPNKRSSLSCGVAGRASKIVNVQKFTNLRRQAGLNGQVISQVPLGATVSVVNPGNFLRYDRCAATCNGTNQTAIKQCIDNNDVWIEVDYNGRRGFLSRKFLE